MNRNVILLTSLLIVICFGQFPQPKSITRDTSVNIKLSSTFSIKPPTNDFLPTLSPMLESLQQSVSYLISSSNPSPPYVTLSSLDISFAQPDVGGSLKYLVLSTNESYQLTIIKASSTTATATLQAENVFGIYRGMLTFIQLALRGLTPLTVIDSPRFKYRGLMLDTGRLFIHPQTIMAILRMASWAKFNVFHWHISDAQTTPFESHLFPKISEGAYSPKEVYSLDNLATIKEFCRRMGMSVVIEFDQPGHSYAWGFGYPEVLPYNSSGSAYCDVADCPSQGALCWAGISPASELMFKLLEGVITEWASGDEFLHLGTDEVETACWENDPAIVSLAENSNGFIDGPFWSFLQRHISIAKNHGISKGIVWDDSFQLFPYPGETTKVLPKDLIVQVWGGNGRSSNPKPIGLEALQRGYQVIMSPATEFYFAGDGNPGWDHYWNVEPTNFDGVKLETNETLLKNLLGGEGALWTERGSGADLWWGIFYNAFLIGERLWSPITTTDQSDAIARIDNFADFVYGFYNDTIQPSAFNASFVSWNQWESSQIYHSNDNSETFESASNSNHKNQNNGNNENSVELSNTELVSPLPIFIVFILEILFF